MRGLGRQALDLVVDGPERVLFDSATDACDGSDLPDAPAHAFRNQNGEMVLFAPNYPNRAFVGADLDHLAHDCAVRFKAAGSADPAMLDDRTWLQGFHTTDGREIFAFASASFIPYRHRIACKAGTANTDCWYNGLAALTSDDGGRTFPISAHRHGTLSLRRPGPTPRPCRPGGLHDGNKYRGVAGSALLDPLAPRRRS